MLMLDNHWMPFATPDTADRMNTQVRTAMIATRIALPVLADAGDDVQATTDLQGAEPE